MKFTNLSTDVLLLILERLPVAELLPALLVSQRWHHLIDSICRRRRTLVLRTRCPFVLADHQRTLDGPYLPLSDHLSVGDLSHPQAVAYLTRHFPAVSNVEFYQEQLPLRQLRQLLEHWRPSLRRLQVTVIEPDPATEGTTAGDWNVLFQFLESGRFTALRTLLVYDMRYLAMTDAQLPFKCLFPQLPQLEHLYYGFCIHSPVAAGARVNVVWRRLRRFGQRICIHSTTYWDIEPKKKLRRFTYDCDHQHDFQLKRPLSEQLTHLEFGLPLEWSDYQWEGNLFSSDFPHLTHLQLRSFHSLQLLITRFRLYGLVHLRFLAVENRRCFNNVPRDEDMLPPADETVPQPVMPALTTLEIRYHMPWQSFHWARQVMPRLRLLNLVPRKCSLANWSKCRTESTPLEEPFWQSLEEWPEGKLQIRKP